jgi:hypothetical protein
MKRTINKSCSLRDEGRAARVMPLIILRGDILRLVEEVVLVLVWYSSLLLPERRTPLLRLRRILL